MSASKRNSEETSHDARQPMAQLPGTARPQSGTDALPPKPPCQPMGGRGQREEALWNESSTATAIGFITIVPLQEDVRSYRSMVRSASRHPSIHREAEQRRCDDRHLVTFSKSLSTMNALDIARAHLADHHGGRGWREMRRLVKEGRLSMDDGWKERQEKAPLDAGIGR